MIDEFSRTKLLIGEEAFQKLRNTTVWYLAWEELVPIV